MNYNLIIRYILRQLIAFFKNPIICRWVDIIFLSVISIVIGLIFADQLFKVSQLCLDFSAHWSPLLIYSSLTLVVVFISFILIRFGGLHPCFTCNTMMRYPPFWFASIIASLIVTIFLMLEHNVSFKFNYEEIINRLPFVFSIFFGSWVTLFWTFLDTQTHNWNPQCASKEMSRNYNVSNNDQDLLNWILEETPIKNPEEDIFGLNLVGRRIARLLLKKSPLSISIVGPYGCGKSSLINLVEYYFNNRENILTNSSENHDIFSGKVICCRIDGWGRTNGSIGKKILELAIEQVKRHVDCMSVVTLPENYNKAISSTNSSGGTIISALLQTSHDPVVQLSKLDNILSAAVLRLVIFLEDLDRNSIEAMIRDEMPALLDRLRGLRQVSFVLAIGTEHYYSDILIRICDHVEAISILAHEYLTKIMREFRRVCLELYQQDVDLISPEDRSKRLENFVEKDLGSLISLVDKGPIDDISRLVKTPRLLKMILRRTFRIWEKLHGEIDFDELLVANVLRFSAPKVFDFLLENIQEIRGLEIKNEISNYDSRLKAVDEKWSRISETSEWDSYSAKKLVQFLFPSWNKSERFNSISSPQSLHVERPTDYWSRFLLEELEVNSTRDQEIIHCIQVWKIEPKRANFKGISLPTMLCNNKEFAAKFEQFSPLILNGYEFRNIASELFTEALSLHGVHTCENVIQGFLPLWRQAIHKPIEENEHLDWVYDQVIKALPKSFRLANDIFHYWNSNSETDLQCQPNLSNIKKQIFNKAKEFYENDTEIFIRAIDPTYMYTSIHFFIYFTCPEDNPSGYIAEEWRWFALLLLKAGILNSQIIIPQIVGLLVDEGNRIGKFINETTYTFNYSLAQELFGEKMPKLMELLSTKINLELFGLKESARIEYTNEAAKQWLAKQVGLE